MGASFNAISYELKMGMDKVRSRWNESVEESQYGDGHEYSGGIGMLGGGFSVSSFVAQDEDEAYTYLEDKHQKWDGAMAIKFHSRKPLTPTQQARRDKIQVQIRELENKKRELENAIGVKFKSRKSKTIGCKNCGSRIAIENVGFRLSCPSCHKSLLTQSTIDKVERAKAKIDVQVEKRNAIKGKASKEPNAILIGGWCSS